MIHRPILYGHRGACYEAPENTLAAFDCALRLGCHAIETDAHRSADGHIVLAHDPDGTRCAGIQARIRDTPLERLQRWPLRQDRDCASVHRIPTLEEALVTFPQAIFNVDAKQEHPDMTRPLVALLRRLNAQDRVTITSFSDSVVQKVRQLQYEGPIGLARLDVLRLSLAPVPLLRLWPLAAHAAQVPLAYGPLRFDTKRWLDKAHALGLRVDFWVVNDPTQAQRLLRLGADGLVTDDPKALAPLFTQAASTLPSASETQKGAPQTTPRA